MHMRTAAGRVQHPGGELQQQPHQALLCEQPSRRAVRHDLRIK